MSKTAGVAKAATDGASRERGRAAGAGSPGPGNPGAGAPGAGAPGGGGTGTGPAKLPPSMQRSQPQLATAYAPGALFTWEGGKGACRTVSVQSFNPIRFSDPNVQAMILEGIQEFCGNWLTRGMVLDGSPARKGIPIYPEQLLDTCFYNSLHRRIEFAIERIEFQPPDRIGYVPGPLAWRCDRCGMLKDYHSASHQIADPLPGRCENGAASHTSAWRQVDVVYVHWSGAVEPLSPFRYTMTKKGEVKQLRRCKCGNEAFRLNKVGAQFSKWNFKCTACGSEREVFQNDPFSLRVLKPRMERGAPHRWDEIHMIPVSYRANPVFYVQASRFIRYSDPAVITLMARGRENELAQKVAEIHGFGTKAPSDADLQAALAAMGKLHQWTPYAMMKSQLDAAEAQGNAPLAAALRPAVDMQRASLEKEVGPRPTSSPALDAQVRDRGAYARRYDPIRLTVEHAALEREKIPGAIDLTEPHPEITAEAGDDDRRRNYRSRVRAHMDAAGISSMYMIRDINMVEYSFGFSRVSATPTSNQKTLPMPVRLMGFPELPNGKRPIYVTEQENEGLYVRLDHDRVVRWLVANGALAAPPAPPRTVGAEVIEGYKDFEAFLPAFRRRDGARESRAPHSYVYLLLHTLAHHVMQGMVRFAGLDLGALGEAIYPADLAFLVHRRGLTEDLGNISSMWRDHNPAFLDYLTSRRELRCGSGTLCDHRGGSCPACLDVPETTCIAGNQLISRAALAGGAAPPWDADEAPLVGFFDPRVR